MRTLAPPPDLPTPVPATTRVSRSATTRAVRSIRRSRIERRSATVAIAMVVGLWLLVVFADALADASAQASRLTREQAVNAALEQRVAAGDVEIATVQSRAFLDFLSRGYRMGELPERSFALAPGAPPPPVITPLGHETVVVPPTTPLDDWLDLLLG